MPLVEDDDMIEKVSPATADETLGDAVLSRAAEAGPLGLDAEALDGADDLFAEVRGAVEYQILRCRVVRESLAQLLRDPRARRTPGDAEVQNPPSIMRDHEETVEHPKRKCRHREEVHRGDDFTMIAQEGHPSLGRLRVSRSFAYPAQHGPLRDVEAEHPELAMNARRSPGWVLTYYAEDQIPHFSWS